MDVHILPFDPPPSPHPPSSTIRNFGSKFLTHSPLPCGRHICMLPRARDPTLAPALYTAGVMGAVLPPPPATQCKTSKNRCRPGECKGSLSFETPNFDFAQSRGLHQFSLLLFPYLHAKNQRICRFRSRAKWKSVHNQVPH